MKALASFLLGLVALLLSVVLFFGFSIISVIGGTLFVIFIFGTLIYMGIEEWWRDRKNK